MRIPEEFQLFGETIKVIWDNEKCDKENAYGLAIYQDNEILLTNKCEGKVLSKQKIEVTYLHEMTHFIIKKAGYDKLSRDEKFVELFSRMLHQILTTQKFKK
jgi:regulator of sirC expression with transglutaminase-like and TPR domain